MQRVKMTCENNHRILLRSMLQSDDEEERCHAIQFLSSFMEYCRDPRTLSYLWACATENSDWFRQSRIRALELMDRCVRKGICHPAQIELNKMYSLCQAFQREHEEAKQKGNLSNVYKEMYEEYCIVMKRFHENCRSQFQSPASTTDVTPTTTTTTTTMAKL
jgi:hypothetical protein